ncbi:MAG: nucleotidyltransferase domain-containing protein [Nocardiopsaceae bacterium]|nr:nucleotidyltransferase domain-containing protein [Nocardiopsaceae bacterium]
MADLDLRSQRRAILADELLAALKRSIPGSRSQLRGSLASGAADEYSDIDICWVVPEASFAEAVASAGAALGRVAAVTSVRADPALARSARRRLLFARLRDVPLFWRVDIDVRAASVAADDHYDVGNPDAHSDSGWSAPASAIENAVAAIKAAARGQAGTSTDLVVRGWQRIGLGPGPAADVADVIISLADACAVLEPGLTNMAAEVREVAEHVLRSDGPA